MAFELPTDRSSTPKFTTVSGFSILRLAAPALRVQYAETAPGWDAVQVQSKTDNNTLVIPQFAATPAKAVGLKLYALDDTLVGTVLTCVVDPAQPELATVTIDGTGLTVAAPVDLKTPRINAFGIQTQEPSLSARQWELAFSSGLAPHAQRMSALLGTITVTVVADALAKLGVAKSVAEIQTAVQQMAEEGNSLDSIIASTFEQLERDRRSGALTASEYTPIGSVPNA